MIYAPVEKVGASINERANEWDGRPINLTTSYPSLAFSVSHTISEFLSQKIIILENIEMKMGDKIAVRRNTFNHLILYDLSDKSNSIDGETDGQTNRPTTL
ncbi:hypothetical protein J6590_016916 [Homalodisca vitripennis]|nr:hypothetical protein J6590_016916 [Homalodisca vitripennis]